MGNIKKELESDGILTSEGIKAWSYQVIQNILMNEKYIGDALLLKTYATDPISKKVVKNLGDQTMYYVENNHPAIIPKDIFNRANMSYRLPFRSFPLPPAMYGSTIHQNGNFMLF